MKTGMNRIALALGRMRVSALLKGNSNKAAKVHAGDFFCGILLRNEPPMEFYSRISIPIRVSSPTPCVVGNQWKYQKKETREILADLKKLARMRSVELTRKDISIFRFTILPLLPESFCGEILRYPEENEDWTDSSFAASFNKIQPLDEIKKNVLTDELAKKIRLLISLNCPSC
jgi:hypothetical protein